MLFRFQANNRGENLTKKHPNMKYKDLRDFISLLKSKKELVYIEQEVSPRLEMTAICEQLIHRQGPAVIFSQPTGFKMPVLGNLFGTTERVAQAMGVNNVQDLREVGRTLASLKEPEPPRGLKDAGKLWHMLRALKDMRLSVDGRPVCQEVVLDGVDVDLMQLPIQWCWPGDVAPLLTWGLTITRGPQNVDAPRSRQNLGVYRQQLIGRNLLIMRWLAHRGGALDFRDFALANPGQPFPLAVAIGADPATILGAVTPIPDTLSEYQFAGLLRGQQTVVANCSVGQGKLKLQVPATAEMVLEGHIPTAPAGFTGHSEMGVPLKEVGSYLYALEGPFGDHTGYYNEQEWFPVFEVSCITHRQDPIYHSTYTGKPIDEPAVLGVALNEVFIPLLQKQFPEIIDFYLPPEGCSYRLAVISIKKSYPGHAKRIMFGLWSFLRQFMYTKFIIVVDDDVNIRDWKEVIWAMTTRMDPCRDTTLVENTPIDYLDFASPESSLGGKMGMDATNKWPGETHRNWGSPIQMDKDVIQKALDIVEKFI